MVFGLFRLLGYRFSPRLADIGGTRFWRIDPKADYGQLNWIARQRVNLELIAAHWNDLLRLAGSLKLGRVPATGIMRTLQVGDRPTRLAQALAEFGRIDKTLHSLTYIDDENRRRATLTQLNRGEGRHSLGRAVFHGKRGELRQRYREGQEDQLGALGLVLNIIVLWNTIYMDAALTQLCAEGYSVRDEDVARLSPLIHAHINMLGRYSLWYRYAATAPVAPGDQLRITSNFRSNGDRFINNELVKVLSLDEQKMVVLRGNGKEAVISRRDLVHVDQGVTVTSFSSQSKGPDQMLCSAPVRSFGAVDRKQFYVTMSRARRSMHLYTDSIDGLRQAVCRTGERLSAVELAQNSEAYLQRMRELLAPNIFHAKRRQTARH